MIKKDLRKIMSHLLLLFCMLKKKNYILLMFQNITQIVKNKLFFLMIPNEEKREAKSEEQWHYLAVKKLSALLGGIISKHRVDLYCLNCLHSFAT